MPSAVYPGRFDPVHNGHVDIARRASMLFDRLVVAVYDSPPQAALFSTAERIDLFSKSVKDVPNVEVRKFSGLASSLAADLGAGFIVRGLPRRLRLRDRVRDDTHVAPSQPQHRGRLHDERPSKTSSSTRAGSKK